MFVTITMQLDAKDRRALALHGIGKRMASAAEAKAWMASLVRSTLQSLSLELDEHDAEQDGKAHG